MEKKFTICELALTLASQAVSGTEGSYEDAAEVLGMASHIVKIQLRNLPVPPFHEPAPA